MGINFNKNSIEEIKRIRCNIMIFNDIYYLYLFQ